MPVQSIDNERMNKELTFKDLVLNLQRWYMFLMTKKTTIVVFCLFGAILGYIYAKYQKPIYVATTTFVLEESDKGGGMGQFAGMASVIGLDLGGGGGGIFEGDNILELYRSRNMIQKTLFSEVVDNGLKTTLLQRYIDFNMLRQKWQSNTALFKLKFVEVNQDNNQRLQDSILGTIVDDITKNYLSVTKPDKKLSIIKTDVKSHDEFFAKNFNEQIVKNVNDFYVTTRTKKSVNNILIMQQKTDSVRAVMNGDIFRSAAVNDATPNLNLTRQVQRTAPVQKSQFNAETNKAILTELVKNLELSKIALRKETPLIQVIDHPIYPLAKTKASKIITAMGGMLLFGSLAIAFLSIRRFLTTL